MSEVLEGWDHNEVMCSYKLNQAIGAYLAKTAKGSARNSEVGLRAGCAGLRAGVHGFGTWTGVALTNRLREIHGRHKIRFDPF